MEHGIKHDLPILSPEGGLGGLLEVADLGVGVSMDFFGTVALSADSVGEIGDGFDWAMSVMSGIWKESVDRWQRKRSAWEMNVPWLTASGLGGDIFTREI